MVFGESQCAATATCAALPCMEDTMPCNISKARCSPLSLSVRATGAEAAAAAHHGRCEASEVGPLRPGPAARGPDGNQVVRAGPHIRRRHLGKRGKRTGFNSWTQKKRRSIKRSSDSAGDIPAVSRPGEDTLTVPTSCMAGANTVWPLRRSALPRDCERSSSPSGQSPSCAPHAMTWP